MQTYDSFNALAAANVSPLTSDVSVFNSTGTANVTTENKSVLADSKVTQSTIDTLTKMLKNVLELLSDGSNSGTQKSNIRAQSLLDTTLYRLSDVLQETVEVLGKDPRLLKTPIQSSTSKTGRHAVSENGNSKILTE